MRRYSVIAYHWGVKKSIVLPYLPEDISLEPTNICNFRCRFCPQSDPAHHDNVPKTRLSPADARIILSKLRQAGVSTTVLHWTLDGEPLLSKELAELCRSAIDHGFFTQILSTNGLLATPEKLRSLPTGPGVTYTLCVDYCADEGLFESCRGSQGSWHRIGRNLRQLSTRRDLDHVRLRVTDIGGYQGGNPQDRAAGWQALRRILPSRIALSRRTFHNATGHLPGPEFRSGRYHQCVYPWTSLAITSNGNVVACCRDLNHKTVLGNLLRQDLLEIWNGPEYRQMRAALANRHPEQIDACKGCDLPYDDSKFGVRNLVKTAVRRLRILGR